MKFKFTKKVVILVCIFIFLINAFFIVKNKTQKEHEYYISNYNDSESYQELSSKHPLKQIFTLKNNEIAKIKLKIADDFNEKDNINLTYTLLCDNEIIDKNTFKLGGIEDNTISIQMHNQIKNIKNKKLEFILESDSDIVLKLKASNNDVLFMSIVSTEQTKYNQIVNILGTMLIFFACIVFLVIFVFNFQFYQVYAVSAFILGIVICFLIPIGNVPDEANAHITTAYHYSNVILGINDDKENVLERKCDNEVMYSYIYVDNNKLSNYVDVMMNDKQLDKKLVHSHQKVATTKFYSFTYYLSGLGITVGRLLGLNGILCVLLGRMFNFILFLLVSTFCIKMIPAYKGIVSFVCLLPMTLQQVFSVSYDSVVFTLAILVTSYTVKLFYNDSLERKEWIILALSTVLISLCKSFSYSPIALVPLSYFIKKIDFSKILCQKKKILGGIIITIIICSMGALFVLKYLRANSVEGSILYILCHPKMFYNYLRFTVFANLESYMSSAMADSLGLFNIQIYKPVLIGYFMMIPYIIFNHEKNEKALPIYTRLTAVLVLFICFTGILLAMYTWSYSVGLIYGNVIGGFQGRYLLPILPLFLISIGNNGYVQNDIIERKGLFISVFLGILSIYSILIVL